MKKLLISLLTGIMVIGATPVQAQDKVYGNIYTKAIVKVKNHMFLLYLQVKTENYILIHLRLTKII